MTTPTYEEVLRGTTHWRFTKDDVSFLLTHQGHYERKPDDPSFIEDYPGTWCYYLLIPEQMYSHRWKDFACTHDDNGFEWPGPAWNSVDFDSEITWSSSEPQWCWKTRRMWDVVKVGCDYAHIWHKERGYPDTHASVKSDAERTVESLLAAHPDRNLKCAHSGVWGKRDAFYEARNGRLVHNSAKEKASESLMGWEPRQ